jgi:hypothetical protein
MIEPSFRPQRIRELLAPHGAAYREIGRELTAARAEAAWELGGVREPSTHFPLLPWNWCDAHFKTAVAA